MTGRSVGYGGEEAAIRKVMSFLKKSVIANRHFCPPLCLQMSCHSERSEESPILVGAAHPGKKNLFI